MSIRNREWQARLRLLVFQLDDTRRQVADIERMIEDFEKKREELQLAIRMEEEQAGVSDPRDVRYPLAALDMRKRHENLGRSIEGLKAQMEIARQRVAEAEEELEKAREQAEREGVDMELMPMPGAANGARASI